jgi:hypothetical protein
VALAGPRGTSSSCSGPTSVVVVGEADVVDKRTAEVACGDGAQAPRNPAPALSAAKASRRRSQQEEVVAHYWSRNRRHGDSEGCDVASGIGWVGCRMMARGGPLTKSVYNSNRPR